MEVQLRSRSGQKLFRWNRQEIHYENEKVSFCYSTLWNRKLGSLEKKMVQCVLKICWHNAKHWSWKYHFPNLNYGMSFIQYDMVQYSILRYVMLLVILRMTETVYKGMPKNGETLCGSNRKEVKQRRLSPETVSQSGLTACGNRGEILKPRRK